MHEKRPVICFNNDNDSLSFTPFEFEISNQVNNNNFLSQQ